MKGIKKFFGCILIFAFALCAFTSCSSKSEKCSEKLREIITAESCTVKTGDRTVFQFDGNTLYFAYNVDKAFAEYYLAIDENGICWKYGKESDERWVRESIEEVRFLSYYLMLRYDIFGIVEDEIGSDIFFALATNIGMCTEEDGDWLKVKEEIYSYADIKLKIESGDLVIFVNDTSYTFTDIDDTEIVLPSEVKNAPKGKVYLP